MITIAKRVAVILLVLASAALWGCNSEPATGPSEPVADLAAPAVPPQLAPSPNTTFSHYPRNVTLAWGAVSDPSGPVTYRVQVEWCQGSVYSPSSCHAASSWCAGTLAGTTTCNFNFIGAQPGRWRVKAIDNAGNESAFSDWSSFGFSM